MITYLFRIQTAEGSAFVQSLPSLPGDTFTIGIEGMDPPIHVQAPALERVPLDGRGIEFTPPHPFVSSVRVVAWPTEPVEP